MNGSYRPESQRIQALVLYEMGNGCRKVAYKLRIPRDTVRWWVKAHHQLADALPYLERGRLTRREQRNVRRYLAVQDALATAITGRMDQLGQGPMTMAKYVEMSKLGGISTDKLIAMENNTPGEAVGRKSRTVQYLRQQLGNRGASHDV